MEFRKTEGIVIKCQDYRRSSQIVTVYTRDYGKVIIIARGINRLRNDLEGPFDLLQYVQVIFMNNPISQINILTGSKIYDNFPRLHFYYNRLPYCMAIAELLKEMTPLEDANPQLFDSVLDVLREIGSEKELEEIRLITMAFLIRAVKILGYLPPTEKGWGKYNLFKNDYFGLFPIIRHIADSKIPLERIKISPDKIEKLGDFMHNYISQFVDCELKIKCYEKNYSFDY